MGGFIMSNGFDKNIFNETLSDAELERVTGGITLKQRLINSVKGNGMSSALLAYYFATAQVHHLLLDSNANVGVTWFT